MNFPWDQRVIAELQNTLGCSECQSSYSIVLRARLLTRIFQSTSSEHHVEDQMHPSFLAAHHVVLVDNLDWVWTTLLSDKELGLEEGKCMSHGMLSPRFPALHKPVASHLSDPISPGAHTTLIRYWVLHWCLKNSNAWKSWKTRTSKMLSWKNQSNTEVQS